MVRGVLLSAVVCFELLAVRGQFAKDAARYLTGSEAEPEKVLKAYRARTDAHSPDPTYPPAAGLPVPSKLSDWLESVGFTQEIFEGEPAHRWQPSRSGKWLWRIVDSRVKDRPRILYRRRMSKTVRGVSLAQTLDSRESKKVRETEISVQRPEGPDWDFHVYDGGGELTAKSTFFARNDSHVTGPAPLTCLTCHYNRSSNRFTHVPTSYLFADKLLPERKANDPAPTN